MLGLRLCREGSIWLWREAGGVRNIEGVSARRCRCAGPGRELVAGGPAGRGRVAVAYGLRRDGCRGSTGRPGAA